MTSIFVRPSSSARLVALALAAALPQLVACSHPASGADAGVPADTGNVRAAPSPSAAPAAAASATPDAPKLGGNGITVVIKDLQLFHPYSGNRTMQAITEADALDTRQQRSRYGLGLVIEATNETGEILRDATFEGVLRFENGPNAVTCHFTADPYQVEYGTHFLSFSAKPAGDTNQKTTWFDESASTNESPWRPSERIRLLTRRTDCQSPVIDDLAPTAIRGRFTVRGRKEFIETVGYEFTDKEYDLFLDGEWAKIRDKKSGRLTAAPLKEVVEMVASEAPKDGRAVSLSKLKLSRFVRTSDADLVESAPVEFDINPRALTLQLVKLPSGDFVHASGNRVVQLNKDGKVVYDDMAKLKMSLHDVERRDVPDTTPEVKFESDELSGHVTSVNLVHYSDEPALSKGQRRLSVTWKLNLRGDAIEGRLRASLDAARAALDTVERASVQAELTGDAATSAKAKADVAKAKAAVTGAETRYKTSLSSERGRLAKLVSCGDVRLVTNLGLRAPSNAKAANDACRALEKDNDVEVTMTYTLDRYELPVALAYALGKTGTWNAIASLPLLKLDSR